MATERQRPEREHARQDERPREELRSNASFGHAERRGLGVSGQQHNSHRNRTGQCTAANLVDLVNSDYWAAPAVPQPVITIKFAQATDIDFVLVTTGAAADYANLARPKDIRINYGSGAQEEMQLKDDPKATCYGLHGRQEKSAAIRVLSVYPSPQGTAVAIAELEFFRFG